MRVGSRYVEPMVSAALMRFAHSTTRYGRSCLAARRTASPSCGEETLERVHDELVVL